MGYQECVNIWDEKRISEYLEYLNTVTNGKVCLDIVQADKGKYPVALTSDCKALIYVPQFLNHVGFSDKDIEAMLIFCYAYAVAKTDVIHDSEDGIPSKDYFQNILQKICKSADREPVTVEYLDKIVTPVRRNIFTSAEDKSYYSVGDVIRYDLCRYTITDIFEEYGDLKIRFKGASPFKSEEKSVHVELEDTIKKYFILENTKINSDFERKD